MTTYEICPTCRGRKEVPGGVAHLAGAQACAWAQCRECDGSGVVPVTVDCGRCLDSGIDLEAPVNLASPPPCPVCHTQKEAA